MGVGMAPLAADEMPPRTEHHENRRRAALEGAWRADPEPRAHHEPQVEPARMDEQPLQHVLMPADMSASEGAGLV
jgi:hypothetical protein